LIVSSFEFIIVLTLSILLVTPIEPAVPSPTTTTLFNTTIAFAFDPV